MLPAGIKNILKYLNFQSRGLDFIYTGINVGFSSIGPCSLCERSDRDILINVLKMWLKILLIGEYNNSSGFVGEQHWF